MGIYKCEWAESKSPDWKIVSLTQGDTKITDVSVNRVNKKGETFLKFDDIKPGFDVEGELWTSQTGKNYLFAPKEVKSAVGNYANKTNTINKAMEKKEKSIEKFQDSKEQSIQKASIIRDATLLTIAQVGKDGGSPEAMEKIWENWQKWLSGKWEQPFI